MPVKKFTDKVTAVSNNVSWSFKTLIIVYDLPIENIARKDICPIPARNRNAANTWKFGANEAPKKATTCTRVEPRKAVFLPNL